MDVKKLDVSTRNGNVDTDFEFTLNNPEIDTLASDVTNAALTAFCIANLGPVAGPVLAVYLISHINDVVNNRGPNGAYVKTTIRNQAVMHIWQVYPQ
ncbi:MAG: hypothetical protein EOO07_30110 [Chitinophagaceae bacterium]|nr:MAG: hypothetical protein EOO07_30110 [Chitinophagaceae bacterium]